MLAERLTHEGMEARDKNKTNTGRLAPDRKTSRGGSTNFIRPEVGNSIPLERGRGGPRLPTSNRTRS